MSVANARARLLGSLKDLHARWEVVQASWDDPVRQKFEAEFLDPLDGHTRHAVEAMEEMSDLIARIRRECS